MKTRHLLSRLFQAFAITTALAVTAASAQTTTINWLQMGQPTNGPAIPLATTAIPSGSQFAMPSGGNVTITHTIAAEANMAMRAQNTSMSNGSVPGYSWATVDSISGSPLIDPLYRSYTITYTFSPAIPAHTLVLGVSGLGRSSDAGGSGPAESNVKVEANGSASALAWQMLGDYELSGSNLGATELRNATNTGAAVPGGPLLLRNSQIAPGGLNPNWNTKFAVVMINQAVSSLTLTVNHVRGDGFTLAVGTVDESCWVAGRDMAANEAITATEAQSQNAVVPQWSYGYRATIAYTADSTAFFPATDHSNTIPFSAGLEGFLTSINSNTPSVLVNPTSAPIARTNMLNVDPGHMEVHPGPGGTASNVVVVRWTAPTAGAYEITASWRDNNASNGNGAIGAIVRNGTTLFSQTWANGGAAVSHHIPSVLLSVNDTIDFVVDANGDYNSDSTDLAAEVCLIGSGEIGITDKGTTPTTDMVDNVSLVKFDCIGVNTSSVRNLDLRNDGTGVLTVSNVTRTGSTDFTISPSLSTATATPGNPFPFTITFQPTSTGIKNAVFHITSNDADGNETIFDIKVTGCGCVPEISIFSWLSSAWLTDNVGKVNFSTVQTCSNAADELYIFNEGCECPLTVKSWSITGANAADFHLVNPPSLPQTVASGPLVLNVEFAPTSTGVKNAVLHIISDDANETSFEINLTGTAIGPNIKVNQLSPAQTLTNNVDDLQFGSIAPNGTITRTYKIYNNGTPGSTLVLGQPSVTPIGPFSVSALSSTSVSGANLSQFTITFTAPATSGCYSAVVSIPSNDCNDNPFVFHVEATSGTTAAPVFTSHPANQIAYLGDPATFTATATCACPVIYDWFNGWAQPAGLGQTLAITHAYSSPYPQDLQFAARAVCDGKITMSNTANLTVVEGLPHTPANRLANGTVTFTAQAWNATGYQWRKISGSGSPLTITSAAIPGATASGFNSATLTLTGLQSPAAGVYVCDVSGHPGTTPLPTKPFQLNINDAAIPLPPNAVGTYGAIIERGTCNGGNGGWLGFTISNTGAVTAASVKLGSTTIPLTLTQQSVVSYNTASVIGVLTNATVIPPVSVEFTIDVASRRFVVGVPTAPSQVTRYGSSSVFQGWRKEPLPTGSPLIGLYNLSLDTPAIANLPQGWSWGSFKVPTAGTYTISGRTACDEAFTFGMFISPGTAPSNKSEIALFSMQPSGSSLVGIFEIVPGTPNLLQNSGLLPPTWKRPVSTSAIYGTGFGPITMTTEGGAYTLATPRVLGVPAGSNNAQVNFTDGGLPAAWNPDRLCTIFGANYTLPQVGNEQTKFTVTGSSGLITNGAFKLLDPSPYAPTGGLIARKTTFTGIVIPLAAGGQEGRGYFMLNKLPSYFGAPPTILSGGARVH